LEDFTNNSDHYIANVPDFYALNTYPNPVRSWYHIRGRTIKFANSLPCACRGSTGQKP